MAPRGSVRFAFDVNEPTPVSGRDLAASLAHEIKNPLQSVFNLLHLLKSELGTEAACHYFELIEQELGRISQIAYGELDEFRGRSTKTEEADVGVVAASVLETYRVNFEAKQIIISTRLLEATIRGSSAQLRQVVANLLLNALDAMPSSGGKLGLRTSASHEWNETSRCGMRLTVADNGCGLTDVQLTDLFDHSFTTKGQAGTGVGLMRVKDIVTHHQGTISVRSTTRLGRSGTVFSIFLPSMMT